MDRKIKAYKKIYRKAIEKTGLNNVDDRVEAYAVRLSKMYASDDFRKHNVYPSTSTLHVYAVIAMCLELKQFGFSDTDIMDYINAGFEARRTFFNVTRDKVEYRISKCMYVEMFETYGIRPLCKIFCNTDTRAYSGLTRHVEFIRHSDLSDGPACHDEVIRKC